MAKAKKLSVGRRDFLKSAVAGAATLALPGEKAGAGEVAQAATRPAMATRPAILMSPLPETDPPIEVGSLNVGRTGSDFMTDVIKTLPFEFICANPADKYRALQESLTGPYGGNKSPEWITCLHEEIAVGMGHGYAKMEGKPLAAFAHSTVGLQHAAMAVYNAYCDRVPVYIVVGNSLDEPGNHSVQDAAHLVSDFIRWDSTPTSLETFAQSAVRAYGYAITPPMMPVLLSVDTAMQENPIKGPDPHIPKLTLPEPPAGDPGSVTEAARLLVQAENPLILVDKYARTQAGTDSLVELAELLQAPVVDQFGRMNFPSRHPLNQSFSGGRGLVSSADVILGLEVTSGIYDTLHSTRDQIGAQTRDLLKPGAKVITIGADGLLTKSNYLDLGRYQAADLAISADAEITMPQLVEAVKRQLTPNQKAAAQVRGAKFAAAQHKAFEQARISATYAWDASPISTGRMCAEVWEVAKDEDWSFVAHANHFDSWPLRTWPIEKHYQWNGMSGGNGMGYNATASMGAALANKKHGRFTINIQCDGDLMYAPQVLWTAAHHRIPILIVMHNNRSYFQELMHIQRMACRHSRGIENVGIGVSISDPNIDFAKLATSLGVYGEGPISDPKDLGPALKRAAVVVKRGEPALVDVVTQPR